MLLVGALHAFDVKDQSCLGMARAVSDIVRLFSLTPP
jgi:hypothetical protein